MALGSLITHDHARLAETAERVRVSNYAAKRSKSSRDHAASTRRITPYVRRAVLCKRATGETAGRQFQACVAGAFDRPAGLPVLRHAAKFANAKCKAESPPPLARIWLCALLLPP